MLSLKLPIEKLGEELRLAAAIKLYELGRLSSGAAAELANVPKPLFLLRLRDFGVDTFELAEEDFLSETRLG
jgi:predicted HTH domain antitoxin